MLSAALSRWFVSWHVQAHGQGARLTVTHSGFDLDDRVQKMARNAFARGWDQVLTMKLPGVLGDCSQK